MCRVVKERNPFLNKQGFKPKLYFLDNEASTALRTTIEDNKIEYQLVLPGNKMKNNVERAIQTFQNYFIAEFSTINKNYPVALWDCDIKQAEIQLNLLCTSRIHKQLLAYQHLSGTLDYNKTPIFPPEQKLLSHIRSEN